MTELILFSQRVTRWWHRYISGPIQWLELRSIRVMGTRFTVAVLTACIFFMTLGAWDLDIPARSGLIIVGVAGVVVGIGSLATGCTYQHLRWMGFVLVVHGVVGIYSGIIDGVNHSEGFIEFWRSDHFVWVWGIITFFGCRLMIFPTPARLAALDSLADIHAAGAQAEIDIRRKD